ncbi:response regulator transcription factor [Acidipila sp. EB88]|uniref:response regulator transcription factor n=1 Tax=Acidipila sp. EB88 TaxID=2305226 RepID=UPI0013159C9B|nr:response regulator transcription factor [Acidipila sp. EB88]
MLIAEDDEKLGMLLRRALLSEASEIELAADGEQAITRFLEQEPALLILDLDLPVRSGMEVLAAARAASPRCSILVVSGRAETQCRIACLDAGADDCLQKPFSLGELRSRCRAMLRRQAALVPDRAAVSPVLTVGALAMDRMLRRVAIADRPVHLTNLEFALLEQLMLAGGNVVTRSFLREAVWQDAARETNVLDVHMGTLRRKLNSTGSTVLLGSVRGVGYSLRVAQPQPVMPRHNSIAPAPVPLEPVIHPGDWAATEARQQRAYQQAYPGGLA